MKKKDEKSNIIEETTIFWKLTNMMDFENVGFCNTVENIKYLCCADCEVGPIGFHDITERNQFYIAVNRVDYQ